MNARSKMYLRQNKKRARELADNKLLAKQLFIKNSIGAADLLGVLSTRQQVLDFDWQKLSSSFVIKPNRGLGGEGILVIFNRLKNGNWLTTNNRQLTVEDFTAHALNILDGNYSLLNTPDTALIEARLSVDPLYKRFSYEGIPDIRIIVYNNVPVMAMVRVPTKKSRGKANLAQGGLGIGVDVSTGLTTHVVTKSWLYEKEIDRHPDTNAMLRGVKLPYWSDILRTALQAVQVSGLKYAGVDISVDKKRGPVVLELNARPGLGIQVANLAPLRERLDRIKNLKVTSPERGIAIARDLFSGQFDAEVSNITGRTIIGLIEPVHVEGKEKVVVQMKAKVDTGADTSSIDEGLARKLGFGKAIDLFKQQHIPDDLTPEAADVLAKELKTKLVVPGSDITRLSMVSSSHGVSIRPHVRVNVKLAGHTMTIEPNVYDRSQLTYQMLLGRRHLTRYLIDPTKVNPKAKLIEEEKET